MDKTCRTLTWFLLFSSVWGIVCAGPTFPFVRITNDLEDNEGVGEAQFSMELIEVSSTEVQFVFRNSGPIASSITDIYFDNGLPVTSSLLSISSIDNSSVGVSFSAGATPHNISGGNDIDFDVTNGLSLDSDPAVQPNGINPGEYLGVSLLASSYNDVLNDLNSGVLRVGLRAQGFADGSSESYVNGISVIPVPASILLAAFGTVIVRILHDRRLKTV